MPQQNKLKMPFNLHPGIGGIENKVVGLGTYMYPSGCQAVCLIMHGGNGQELSVDLGDEAARSLGDGEFFAKDWGPFAAVFKRVSNVGLVQATGPRYTHEHADVPVAGINGAMLVPFTGAELAQYTP